MIIIIIIVLDLFYFFFVTDVSWLIYYNILLSYVYNDVHDECLLTRVTYKIFIMITIYYDELFVFYIFVIYKYLYVYVGKKKRVMKNNILNLQTFVSSNLFVYLHIWMYIYRFITTSKSQDVIDCILFTAFRNKLIMDFRKNINEI